MLADIATRLPKWQHFFTAKVLFGWDGSAPKRTSTTAWLDGLRGVAAVQVFFFHFFGRYASWGNPWGSTPESKYIHQLVIFRPLWAGGSGAVSIFFVISGYAITCKSLNLIRPKNYEKIFKGLCSSFFRRGFRLYLPIFLLAIPTIFLIQLVDMTDGFIFPEERKDTLGDQIIHFINATDSAFNAFAYKSDGRTNHYTYVPTAWTIPYEYYGSIVCYLMILAISRVDIFLTRLSILGIVALYSIHRGCWWVSNFVIGMIIADWSIEQKHRQPPAIPISRMWRVLHDTFYCILVLFGLYLSGAPPKVIAFDFHPVPRVGYEWLYKFSPRFAIVQIDESIRFWWYMCGNLVVLGVSQVSWLRYLFTSKFCRWLGQISFALYLVHEIIISALSLPLNGVIEMTTENKILICLWQFCVQTPLIVFLSAVVERWIDRPSIQFARWLEGLAFAEKVEVERTGESGHEMVGLISSV
jgi:peptidoglycan/LPS O-acetylase OafA/YrhL